MLHPDKYRCTFFDVEGDLVAGQIKAAENMWGAVHKVHTEKGQVTLESTEGKIIITKKLQMPSLWVTRSMMPKR